MTANIEFGPAANDAEIHAAYDVAAHVFGPNYAESSVHKARLLRAEPPADPRDVVVARRGGEVVGLTRIVDRTLMLGGRSLKAGGITAVAVRPDLQGLGAGRGIMDAAITRSRERGDVLSVAFARRAVDGFYWRLGYVGIGCHPRMTVKLPADRQGGATSVVPGLDAGRMDFYRDAYETTYGRLALRFDRDARIWTLIAARLGWTTSPALLTVLDGGDAIGYFVVADGVVIEAAALGQMDALARAVLAHAASREELTLALHPSHPLAVALRGLNHTLAIRYAWDGGHVVRVLDAAAFAGALAADAGIPAAWPGLDLTRHDDARRMLLDVAGIGGTPMMALPVWSWIDEF